MQQLREYSVPIEPAKAGQSAVYRHPLSKDGFLPPKDARKINLQQQMLVAFENYGDKPTLGIYNEEKKQYEHITYNQIKEITTALGSGLLTSNLIQEVSDERGLKLKPVGIYLKNRREWTLIDITCQLFGLTSIPFYDTLGKESIKYGVESTNVTVCFVESKTAAVLAEADIPTLQLVVAVEPLEEQTLNNFKGKNIKVIEWNQLVEEGKKSIQPFPVVDPKLPFTVVFTSGTTGVPKAAAQTHENCISMITLFDYDNDLHIRPDDVYLSYLPLPHTFERVLHLAFLNAGGEINYASGDKLKLQLDIQKCKPTFFGSVPRVFNRFYENIQLSFNSLPAEQKAGVDKAVAAKIMQLQATGITQHDQLDQMVFAKTRASLGGRQRVIITGAAPISPSVLEFLKVTLCCQMVEVYGQTETMGGSFFTDFKDPQSGYVGGPSLNQEYKLVDVPDMGYHSTDVVKGVPTPRGEVCIRGPCIFKGYFKDTQKTNEALDAEGFCHTGDVGQILPNGALQIIDRKKNIFKLAQGEYVSPERIENCYVRALGVSECLVLGDSLKQYCVGVVVPEPNYLKKQALELNINGTIEELCQNKQLRELILKNCNLQGVNEKLNGFEQIKNVYLESKIFADVGLLTETQKMQRHKANKHYQDVARGLYEEIEK